MVGISSQEIVKFIEKNTNDGLKRNFIGVLPPNYINKFFMRSLLNQRQLSICDDEYRQI